MKNFIINWIKEFYSIDKSAPLEELINNPAYQSHEFLWMLLLFAGMSAILIFVWFSARQLMLVITKSISKKSKTAFYDLLVEKKFFKALAIIPTLLLMNNFYSIVFFSYPNVLDYLIRLNEVLFILAILVSIRRLLNALNVILENKPLLKDKPIGAYTQTVKLAITIAFVIILLSVITKQSPLFFLTSLGAMTAIILLVFKDTILGFVGSILISANDILRIGDWITMEKFGADGTVLEINLTTVKVQNFDKTITTIPTYNFISDSFKNWRGMFESGGRRIKRSVNIKIDSIKFADKELIEKLSKVKLFSDFVLEQQKEIKEYNKENHLDDEYQINARRPTNIGLFRRYIEYYLKNNHNLNHNLSLMVRQLQAGSKGLPIELYCFTKSTTWVIYENVMSDIFDHLFAVVDKFDLEIHEELTGSDLKSQSAN